MPLLGVAMAQPINRNPEVYIFPNEQEMRKMQKKYLYMKGLELVFIIMAMILFTLSVNASECSIREMFISGVFGALLIYPVLMLILSINIKGNVEMLILNSLCAAALLTTGFIIFSSWYEMQAGLLAEDDIIYRKIKKAATQKLAAAITTLLTGIFYLSEAFILLLEKLGYL